MIDRLARVAAAVDADVVARGMVFPIKTSFQFIEQGHHCGSLFESGVEKRRAVPFGNDENMTGGNGEEIESGIYQLVSEKDFAPRRAEDALSQ